MLRRATMGDVCNLGAVHVASWKETYAGILPEDMLAGLSIEARSAMWARILDDPSAFGRTAVYVAEDGTGIIGLSACGQQRDHRLRERGFDAEISAIYVLRSQQRRGIGRALMREMALDLRYREFDAAALWVLRENTTARDFYRKLGGEMVAEREDKRENATLVEIAYGWRELWRLTGDRSSQNS